MANLAVALKDEIRRLARKVVRQETSAIAKSASRLRRELATLKQRLAAQERKLVSLEKRDRKQKDRPPADDDEQLGVRFSARSVKSQRARLGLSAHDYALLVGVSPLTIYNWENGKSRPRASQLASLVAVRGIGKREAVARLKQLRAK
jgi:DNA-binding transcriptional regulator YiaG